MFDVKHILILASAYLVGAIPTGYWFAKIFFDLDITQNGSGNIGATNVARLLGKRYFLLIFLIDAGKAYATLYIVNTITQTSPYMMFACAIALLLGNAYSPFLGFRGGKGVATSLGIFAFMLPSMFLFAFITIWLTTLLLFKEVFIASLTASFLLMLIYALCVGITHVLLFLSFISLWLLIRHKKNIASFRKTKT